MKRRFLFVGQPPHAGWPENLPGYGTSLQGLLKTHFPEVMHLHWIVPKVFGDRWRELSREAAPWATPERRVFTFPVDAAGRWQAFRTAVSEDTPPDTAMIFVAEKRLSTCVYASVEAGRPDLGRPHDHKAVSSLMEADIDQEGDRFTVEIVQEVMWSSS